MFACVEVVLLEAVGREARLRQVGLVDVERVEEAFEHVVGAFHAGFPEVFAVGDGLAPEGLARADEGVAGGQSAVVGLAGRRRVGRDPGGAIQDAEVFLPAEVVELGVPDFVVVVAGRFGVAVVEHRVQRHLIRDLDLPAVPGQDAERRGQSASRALPADEDLVGPDPELVGMLDHPFERGVAVFDGGRVGVFVGEPVPRRHHHRPVLLDQLFGPSDPLGHRLHPRDIPPAVQPQNPRPELPGLVSLGTLFSPFLALLGLPLLAFSLAVLLVLLPLKPAQIPLQPALFAPLRPFRLPLLAARLLLFGRKDQDPHLLVLGTGNPIRARPHLRTGSDRQTHHQADYG